MGEEPCQTPPPPAVLTPGDSVKVPAGREIVIYLTRPRSALEVHSPGLFALGVLVGLVAGYLLGLYQ